MIDWLKLMGVLHPIVVHFPIALLLTASFLEVVSLWRKDDSGLRFVIVVNLMLGTLAAIIAAILGWIDAAHIGMEADLKPVLLWHRWLGTAVAIEAVIVSILCFRCIEMRSLPLLLLYRSSLLGLAFLVVITGHLGGLLVYGLDYFSIL